MASSSSHDFAAFLREELRSRRIRQQDFAAMVQVSENTVSSWTTGKYRPDHEKSERIAAVLGITIDELHGRPRPAGDGHRGERAARPSRPAASEYAAERIVRQLAALEVDEPLENLQRTTPSLLRILAEARTHATRRNGDGR